MCVELGRLGLVVGVGVGVDEAGNRGEVNMCFNTEVE